jgi:ABC-type transport system involved in cytochrome c biogenesis ATPase subunit
MLDAHAASPALIDRVSERGVLDRLVAGVRAGQSQVLVLRGVVGVGKTALLRHLTAAAEGYRITGATGVESEAELAFAGLHASRWNESARLLHLRTLVR